MNKDSWEIKTMGEIGFIITGNTPKTSISKNYDSKDIYFVKPGDILNNEITFLDSSEAYISEFARDQARILPIGSVLVTCIGIIGKIAITNKEVSINQQINAIVPSNNILSEFLAYSLLNAKDTLNRIANAPVVPIINKTQFSALTISVPPITIQEQIVKELDTLSDIITKKKEQLAELDKLAQATFYDMFGDPIENEKEWNNKLWNEVLSIYNGKNQKKVENKNGEYPICGSGGIMGYADAYICPENTVIIGRKGNINKPIFMRKKFWNVDTAFGLVANYNKLNPNFLFYFCLNYNFEKHNKAVTIPSLTKTDLLKIAMPCPPLSLQNQFAKKIEAIEQQKELINKSITDVQLLFDYTMDKYFN